MKCKKTELGLELIPENNFEKECLQHLASQNSIVSRFQDNWNQTGNLIIEGKDKGWTNSPGDR